MKFYLLGSSHAKRLLDSFVKCFPKETFVDLTKSGAKVKDLVLPSLKNISRRDIWVLQLFGNDLFQKRYIEIERFKRGEKIIHLTQFAPVSKEQITQAYQKIYDFIKNLDCRVYLIDNPIRHIQCCKKHQDARIPTFQYKQNILLKRYFQDLGHVKVIDHRKLLHINIRQKKLKTNRIYAKLLQDSVHFKTRLYDVMAQKLMSNFILK
jgi:hypothetical protein